MARVRSDAQKQSFERNGFEDYEFIAEPKDCPICAALNGKHFKVAKMMPGENAAPMHPYCRCSVAAWEDSDDYEAWLDFLDKGGTTEEWKNDKLNFYGTSEKGYLKGIINRSGSNKVDMQYIESEEYRRKFTQITENSEVNQKIRQTAKAILTHRKGTDFEDTYIIDLSTGKTLIKEVNSKEPLTVTIKSDDFKRAMKDARGRIMGIHNHPTNMPPSGADFVVAGSRGYDFGLVITHSGEIYWYKTGDQVFLPQSIDLRVEKKIEESYNKNIVKAHECALDDAKEAYGIQWGKLK